MFPFQDWRQDILIGGALLPVHARGSRAVELQSTVEEKFDAPSCGLLYNSAYRGIHA